MHRKFTDAASARVLSNPEYGVSRSEIGSIQHKLNNGIELSADELRKYRTFDSEVGATMSEYYLGNEDFIHRLIIEDAPLAERVIDKLAALRASLARLPNAEARAEYKHLRRAEKLYLKATRAAGNMRLYNKLLASINEDEIEEENNAIEPLTDKNNENSVSDNVRTTNVSNMGDSVGAVKYSFKGINKDEIEVYETSEEIKKLSYRERQKVFLDVMREQYRGRTAKFIRNGHPYYAVFEEDDVRKNIYGDKRPDVNGIKAKINVGAEGNIFELVENAKYDGSKPESGKNISSHKNVIYWDYFIKNVQIDNRVFDLVANVRKKADGSFVYSIELKENKKVEASPPRSSLLRASSGVPNASTKNSISDSREKVNTDTKYSYKIPAESKVYQRTAEWEKLKVYEKRDAEKMINTIISDVLPLSDSESAALTLESRKQAEKLLWAKLNSALTDKEMKKAAEQVADYVISQSIVKSWMSDPYEISELENAERALAHLRPLLHRLRLSGFSSEIKHRFDKSANGVMLMWGTRKTGIGVDEILPELNREISGYGFPIDAAASEA